MPNIPDISFTRANINDLGIAWSPAILGTAIGLAAALLFGRLLATLLYGVSATDPLVFVAAPVLLLATAVAACAIPAHRATRIDPLEALRYE